MEERLTFVDENPDHPGIDDLTEKAATSTRRFHELQAELVEWTGAAPAEYDALFREVQTELQRREIRETT